MFAANGNEGIPGLCILRNAHSCDLRLRVALELSGTSDGSTLSLTLRFGSEMEPMEVFGPYDSTPECGLKHLAARLIHHADLDLVFQHMQVPLATP